MLPQSLTSTASFIDLLMDAVCVVDTGGRFVWVSAAFERIFGYTQQEIIGRQMIELVAPGDRDRTLQAASRIMDGQPLLNFENRYLRKDGSIVHILWSARWCAEQKLRIAVARDITSIKRNEALQAALYAISEAAHASDDVVALVRQIHATIGALLGAPGMSVALAGSGGEPDFVYHAERPGLPPGTPSAAFRDVCAEVMRTRAPLSQESGQPAADPAVCSWLGAPLDTGSGTIGALVVHSGPGCAPLADGAAELLQFVSTQVATAIARKQMHARLSRMAQYDELTGLPNRRLLYDRIGTAITRGRRQQLQFALLFLDLDGFKKVNDIFGHAVGDLVLKEFAARTLECVRAVDTVARLGGDEFVVLLDSVTLPEHAALVAEKIRATVRQPIDIGQGRILRMVPSVGMAIYPADGDSLDELLRHADAAMYVAKQAATG